MSLPVHQPIAAESREQISRVIERLEESYLGNRALIELSLATFLAGGHLLLEGPPGAGKTSLAKALAQVFGGEFKRVQMTTDLLPSDLVGFLRIKPGTQELEFRKGPVFSHFLLADELNRATPKSQSALLEAMAEGTVSVDGTTHPLPKPFFVIATQNPLEHQGVFPLPESQLDRFMLVLSVDMPEKSVEMTIYSRSPIQQRELAITRQMNGALLNIRDAERLRSDAQSVHASADVLEYATDILRLTRNHSDIAYGVSVRGGLQWISAARALAMIRGRDFVTPKDLQDTAIPSLAHRIFLTQDGSMEGNQRIAQIKVLQEILGRVRAPK